MSDRLDECSDPSSDYRPNSLIIWSSSPCRPTIQILLLEIITSPYTTYFNSDPYVNRPNEQSDRDTACTPGCLATNPNTSHSHNKIHSSPYPHPTMAEPREARPLPVDRHSTRWAPSRGGDGGAGSTPSYSSPRSSG